ncbi:site-specific integrase [Nocardia sp. NPDC003482]
MTLLQVVDQLHDADEAAARLREGLTSDFLASVGWSDEARVLHFPQDHSLLGWIGCPVSNCDQPGSGRTGLCSGCQARWKGSGEPDLGEFAAVPRVRLRFRKVGSCSVPDCPRPWRTQHIAVCSSHQWQQREILKLPLAEFLVHPDVVPLTGFGPCQVAACTRDRDGKGPYCHCHRSRRAELIRRLKAGKIQEWDEEEWRRTDNGAPVRDEVSLRGLPDRVVAEILFGLQQRIARGIKTAPYAIRRIADCTRRARCTSLAELDRRTIGKDTGIVHKMLQEAVARGLRHPDTERLKDEWDATVFGGKGTLTFTKIAQPWLREAAKIFAADELPRHRGKEITNVVRGYLRSLEMLSDSLRLQRADRGLDPSALGRSDITAFLNRLAHLHTTEVISSYQWIHWVRFLRVALQRMRTLALGRAGQPLHGLAEDFAIDSGDIPDEPDDAPAGKDLPTEVLRFLCQHLGGLEEVGAREIRVATELIIDTGRRPDEICQLMLDCLERDEQGRPVLVYDNLKANRMGRRLPITEPTAAVIENQQRHTRNRYPDEPLGKLKLLAAIHRNPHGRRGITCSWLSTRHREWVDRLPDIEIPLTVEVDGTLVRRMLPFDKSRIVLYAYRHTWAQRHADAGVPVDVLCELMDHLHMSTTQGYYRVGETRRREAVDRVTAMQFDRHGNRVWREAKALLDSEHLRRAVGEIAVPYGTCSEPSNVAAGGDDCPVRFRCVGCAHFSTDVSYLPDLEAYLSDLLRSRERLRSAFTAADDWAKTEAMPSDEEITRIRRLIARIKADVDELTDEDRSQIEEAIGVVRRARNSVVGLGLPRVRQPIPEIRPDRSA